MRPVLSFRHIGHSTHHTRWLTIVLVLVSALGVLHTARPASATPQLQSTAPDTLVSDGALSYALATPKVFWYSAFNCPAPSLAGRSAIASSSAAGTGLNMTQINRIATYGSPSRSLFSSPLNPPPLCNPYRVSSNLVADDQFVYWAGPSGLMRLATDANIGDTPQLLSSLGVGADELAVGQDAIFSLTVGDGATLIQQIRTSDGATSVLAVQSGTAADLTFDGEYLYWIVRDLREPAPPGVLRRLKVADRSITTLASSVTGYHAEGTRTNIFCLPNCRPVITKFVFIARGHEVLRQNNIDNTTTPPIYTSTDSTAVVYSLTSDNNYVFLFESRTGGNVLQRATRGGSTAATLYTHTSGGRDAERLTSDGQFLFWQEGRRTIRRLSVDANPLALTNLRVTGIEVTQGIQDLNNSVLLIQNRRTFARVYVESEGASVAGVAAELSGTWDGGEGGPLQPLNSAARLTVQATPSRDNLDDSFLFELPPEWTTKTNLRLRAVLNPYHYPPEPTYADNSRSVGPLTFNSSPRLEVQFVAFEYELNGTRYRPRYDQDLLQTFSWIRRAYPLASTPGFSGDPSPGFRPRLPWLVLESDLGARVDRSHPACDVYLERNPDGTIKRDQRNLCASAYTNERLKALRTEYGISADTFMYGMISDAGGFFPRGQAGGDNVSSGPAGSSTGSWDTDGSYADWYAAHEIGHSLGRGHPAPGSKTCGHSADDDQYPYEEAAIGPPDGSVAGFDAGDPQFAIPRAVYSSAIWHDVMSYCDNQWVSDYTYKGLYAAMSAGSTATVRAQATAVNGDWLSLFGGIAADGSRAAIDHVQRRSSVASMPLRQPGAYAIQLLDAQGNTIASYAFTPRPLNEDEGSGFSFNQVVPFAASAREVRIVHLARSQVLARQSISANPPVVASVALQGTPNTGTAILNWTASDPDGDVLRFDVLYSRDSGATFQPLVLGITTPSLPIDFARLGGGRALLRVIASDGAQSAQGDSAPFTVANKRPQPRILTPADGTRIHYGQLVTFSGEAEDLQDGGVGSTGLAWRDQNGHLLGTGPQVALDNLPIGANRITLTATNRTGLSASTSITVIVTDELDLPGPILSAGPMQVGWHIGLSSTARPTAQLHISNSGGGSLRWSASSDATWLRLSAASGQAPATLTLSAETTDLAPGSTRTAHLTLTAPSGSGRPAQTLIITVSLAAGNVLANPGPASRPTGRIYVPLVQR
jgi:Viral BACON domain